MHGTVHATDGSIKKLTNSKNNICSGGIRVSTFPSIYSEALPVKWEK